MQSSDGLSPDDRINIKVFVFLVNANFMENRHKTVQHVLDFNHFCCNGMRVVTDNSLLGSHKGRKGRVEASHRFDNDPEEHMLCAAVENCWESG